MVAVTSAWRRGIDRKRRSALIRGASSRAASALNGMSPSAPKDARANRLGVRRPMCSVINGLKHQGAAGVRGGNEPPTSIVLSGDFFWRVISLPGAVGGRLQGRRCHMLSRRR